MTTSLTVSDKLPEHAVFRETLAAGNRGFTK
jgi:hypothetical protein